MDSDRAARTSLLFELAEALQRVGTGTARVEETLARVAGAIGVQGWFFALPDAVWATLQFGDGEPVTHLVPAPGGDVDLAGLDALRTLSQQLMDGDLGVAEARAELARLAARPPTWGPRAVVAAFAVASMGAAVLFGGRLGEAVVSGVIGLGIGWLVLRGAAWRLGRLVDVLAAGWAALLATLASTLFGTATDAVVVAGLIVLVPGFTIHRGMTDLSTGHLVSGTLRVAVAGTALLLMGFGVALGAQGAEALLGPSPVVAAGAGDVGLSTLAIVLMTPALLVLFQAPLRAAPWALGSVTVAWFGSLLGARMLGPELGAFVAALAVGLYANGWSRATNRPAAIPLAPGLLLLVPGAMGFRGVAALLDGDAVAAMQTGFSTLLVAVALVCGLLVANLVVAAPEHIKRGRPGRDPGTARPRRSPGAAPTPTA